jgi:hypothetical protein
MLMTLRFLINSKLDLPFGEEVGPEYQDFMIKYMDYLRVIEFDDISHWEEGDFEYFN